MSKVTIELDDRLVRRLNSIVRGSDKLILMHTGKMLHVVSDKGDFFKSISINSNSDTEMFLECDPMQLKLLSIAGSLTIELETHLLNLYYHIGSGENRVCLWHNQSMVEVFTRFHLQSYLNVIENKNSNIFRIEALSNIKELIAACSATTSGLEIVNGKAVTKSNNLIIYQNIVDKELKVSFTNTSLKEMDKFKLDCESSSIGNYIIMFRDDYTLAVKKGVSGSTSKIPMQYLNDDFAQYRVKLNLHVLLPMLDEINYKELGGVCECRIDLVRQIATIEIGTMVFRIAIPIHEVKKISELDMKLETIKFNLLELKSASRMLKQTKEHELMLYPGVARLKLKHSNLIVRYEVG